MTAAELHRLFPSELADLEFDHNQDGLSLLLQKAGEKVEAFFRYFTNTYSKEQVRLQRFRWDGVEEASASKDYRYLILSHAGEEVISFEEDRVDSKGNPLTQDETFGFFISAGYATLTLYIHPSHQMGSRFRYLGRQTSKHRAYVIAFAQKPEAGDYLSTYSSNIFLESTRLLVQGIAWVDPDTYQIVRMRTNLLATEDPVSLREQTADIQFSEVRFKDMPQSFWLPRDVQVSWKLAGGKSFSNRHRYSDYQLFTIESYDKIDRPQITK